MIIPLLFLSMNNFGRNHELISWFQGSFALVGRHSWRKLCCNAWRSSCYCWGVLFIFGWSGFWATAIWSQTWSWFARSLYRLLPKLPFLKNIWRKLVILLIFPELSSVDSELRLQAVLPRDFKSGQHRPHFLRNRNHLLRLSFNPSTLLLAKTAVEYLLGRERGHTNTHCLRQLDIVDFHCCGLAHLAPCYFDVAVCDIVWIIDPRQTHKILLASKCPSHPWYRSFLSVKIHILNIFIRLLRLFMYIKSIDYCFVKYVFVLYFYVLIVIVAPKRVEINWLRCDACHLRFLAGLVYQ